MESLGNIYYVIPDNFRRDYRLIPLLRSIKRGALIEHLKQNWWVKPKPVGGIKVIYQHCQMLSKAGVNAFPILYGEYEGNFFGFSLRTKKVSEIQDSLTANDIVVIPEHVAPIVNEFKPAKCVLFVQCHTIYKHQNWNNSLSYGQQGFAQVMYCSEHLRQYLTKEDVDQLSYVPNFIDFDVFKPQPQKRVKNRILALSNKNLKDLKRVTSDVRLSSYDFKLVDGLQQHELVEQYQAADIFVTVAYPEGFGLPALEAMACGCIVVGFSGGGADEYMINGETAMVAKDGDCEQLIILLQQVLSDRELRERIRSNGMVKALEYKRERSESLLLDSFSKIAG